jgi:hypothetical protein
LRLRDTPEHGVLRLVRHDSIEAHLVRDSQRVSDLIRRPLTDANVKSLAAAHDVVERPHRLFERDPVVEAVSLVEIDVIRLQSSQRLVNRLNDVLAGQPSVVGVLAHGPEQLRRS